MPRSFSSGFACGQCNCLTHSRTSASRALSPVDAKINSPSTEPDCDTLMQMTAAVSTRSGGTGGSSWAAARIGMQTQPAMEMAVRIRNERFISHTIQQFSMAGKNGSKAAVGASGRNGWKTDISFVLGSTRRSLPASNETSRSERQSEGRHEQSHGPKNRPWQRRSSSLGFSRSC